MYNSLVSVQNDCHDVQTIHHAGCEFIKKALEKCFMLPHPFYLIEVTYTKAVEYNIRLPMSSNNKIAITICTPLPAVCKFFIAIPWLFPPTSSLLRLDIFHGLFLRLALGRWRLDLLRCRCRLLRLWLGMGFGSWSLASG